MNVHKFDAKIKRQYLKMDIGDKVGLLTAVSFFIDHRGKVFAECKCICGNVVNLRLDTAFRKSAWPSCGCHVPRPRKT